MTSGQRKAHKVIWIVLLISIPVLMFFSIKNLNFYEVKKENIGNVASTKKQDLLKTVENDLIRVNLYPKTIEIILKTTLKNASSVVYSGDSQGNKNQLIGQLTTTGIYNFDVEKLPKSILIYDELKKERITKLNF